MAVVVRQDKNNKYYKLHRIATPDGRLFVLENENSSSETAGLETSPNSIASPAVAAVNSNVTQNASSVNAENGQSNTAAQMPSVERRFIP